MEEMKVSRILMILAFLFWCPIYSEASGQNWGKEEGSLNWKSAVEKCKSNGMRLPTKKELLSLYKTKEYKKWEQNWYWTNDELDTERAWIVVLNVGDTAHIPKQYHNFVRCIH